MSEKEKRIVEKLKEAIPNMSEFDKGYILGKTESFSENKPDDSGKAQETLAPYKESRAHLEKIIS